VKAKIEKPDRVVNEKGDHVGTVMSIGGSERTKSTASCVIRLFQASNIMKSIRRGHGDQEPTSLRYDEESSDPANKKAWSTDHLLHLRRTG